MRPKKHLGQHFLKEASIAANIAGLLLPQGQARTVLEIGPGTGVLTQHLLGRPDADLWVIDVDGESIEHLKAHLPLPHERIIHGDFLAMDLAAKFDGPVSLIGNLPYNISSQIFFKMLENRAQVPEMVCMVQKEVAERIAAKPGGKVYGILSVLLQAYYHIAYEFTVHEDAFLPPPKVKSAVITLRRNQVAALDCNERLFFQVVKMAFNQRRKTLRNALRGMANQVAHSPDLLSDPVFDLRAERLSVADFVRLTRMLTVHTQT